MNYATALVSLPLVCECSGGSIRTPEEARKACQDLAKLAQEFFHVLSLNAKQKLINRHLVTLGLVDATAVHPREVFRAAIKDGASGIIVVHNHPSGDTTPSAEDLRITRQLVEAGKIVGIKVVDHIIIGRPVEFVGDQPGRPGYLSLRESGLIAFT
jgi:DNA repair protein RadC